jgi:hypothetical protein
MAEIFYTSTETDEDGNEWYVINGSEYYNLTSGWTKEEAERHYTSPEGTMEREIAFMRAYGFYD